MPRRADGLGVVSFGSVLAAGRPFELESVAHGDAHTWRATREFALLAQLLAGVRWGELDVLLFDLPPGAERTVHYADFLGDTTGFVLVTIPSEMALAVVSRSVAAVQATGSPLLGVVENMAGYACAKCLEVRPLFPPAESPTDVPVLGFDSVRPRLGRPLRRRLRTARRRSQRVPGVGGSRCHRRPYPCTPRLRLSGDCLMKFLCVTCDEPMTLERAAPPDDAGSITAVYACPTCSHQIAMLTNAHETQLVQSLGVQIGPGAADRAAAGGCPFSGMVAEMESSEHGVRWTETALARLERVPEFVRPMARQGVEHYAKTHGHAVVDEAVMEEARGRFGM